MLAATYVPLSRAQQTNPAAKESTPAPTEKNAAQIELLETKYRFETNGDSRKEVHARVRINNELGARQFARLNFDFNSSFQSVEIPFVRVTHASGGTADILPSATADHPNPSVADYPAYHDIRVKSVRILGLKPDDLLEYRVITTTTHHPLAPDFWLDHTFDRTGVVSQEIFALDLPGKTDATRSMDLPHAPGAVYAGVPYSNRSTSADNGEVRSVYTWTIGPSSKLPARDDDAAAAPDVAVTSFNTWNSLATRLAAILQNASARDRAGAESALHSVAPQPGSPATAMRAAYDFVAQKIVTLDLPPETTAFRRRPVEEILDSRYGTLQEKCFLLALMGELAGVKSEIVLTVPPGEPHHFARPSLLGRPFVLTQLDKNLIALDPNLEVAPFAAVPPEFRGKSALSLAGGKHTDTAWERLPAVSPFDAFQKVNIEAALSADGNLTAKARYIMRGDNELLLRVAFHKTEKDKWKDVAQMLALSDGFRGQIVQVNASDPYSTKDPFTVEYEISQPKFVDWTKKTVRIPAILPLPGLPDAPAAAESEAKKPIELGTPLAIDLEATIELPAGAMAQAPIGTSVTRDYATFTSKYSVQGNTLHASRSLHFISSELPASRAVDFTAFLHAVQADQTQLFTVRESAAH
jgi:Domain of Unknown Function with PDB structure (DUF3857)